MKGTRVTNPTRIDGGSSSTKLAILIEYDVERCFTTIETNIQDSVVFTRILGDAMHVWASDLMKKRAEAASRIKLPDAALRM